MKLKTVVIITTLCTTLAMHCCETSNTITIRPATLNDLDAIHEFNKNCFQKNFKPIVAQTITTEQKLDSFMDKLIIRHQDYCQNFITKQLNQEEYCIIVAHKTFIEKETPLIGYCRFFKKNEHTIQIGFIGVDELFRKQGIAKKLAFAAMKTFNGITKCNFRTFSNYDFINELYSKLGCIKTGIALLDPNTQEFVTNTTNSNSLISFNDYSYIIKK